MKKLKVNNLKLLIFDLDDTLYDESSYVASGFNSVASRFYQELGVSQSDLNAAFLTVLKNEGRGRVFNQAIKALGKKDSNLLVDEMVMHYRAHRPNIELYAGVSSLLSELNKKYRLVMVTDGLAKMQKNKVAALKINDQFEDVCYCWEYDAPKPATKAYRQIKGFESSSSIIIGDNPEHDGIAAKALGVPFVRVLTGRFSEIEGGDIVLPSVLDLPSVLSL